MDASGASVRNLSDEVRQAGTRGADAERLTALNLFRAVRVAHKFGSIYELRPVGLLGLGWWVCVGSGSPSSSFVVVVRGGWLA
jgi:hypothetical protein